MQSSRLRLTALALVVASASIASAQLSSTNQFGLKLGVFFPTDSTVRSDVGSTGFNVGISYFLKDLSNEQESFDVDFFRVGGSDYFQEVSLGYTSRYYSMTSGSQTAPYLGFSAGISFNRVSATTGSSGGSGGSSVSDNKTVPYGEILAGYRFSKGMGVEAFYRLTSDLDGFHTNAFGVRLNYKF